MLDAYWGRFAASTTTLLFCAACASAQLNYNTVEISSTIDSVYTREALDNLSKFIDDPFAIPSQIIMVGGTIQTVNTVNPSVTFPLTAQIAGTATLRERRDGERGGAPARADAATAVRVAPRGAAAG